MNIDDKKLDEIFYDYSKLTVGRLCKQAEVIQLSDAFKSNSQLKEAISLLKSLHKETVYEIFRDLKYCLKLGSQGKVIQYKIYNPTMPKS